MNPKDINEAYANLAMAIVEKAIKDYMDYGDSYKNSVIRFFKSEWYSVLCRYDGDYILRLMDDELEKRKKKKKH